MGFTMSHWSHGYNAENSYVSAFFPQNTPCWLDWANTLAGGVPPRQRSAGSRLRYLDLGCGTGFGVVALAAMYPEMDFVGVDFMPEHIVQARHWVQQAGLGNARFVEADFVQLQHAWPQELGQFDYVVGHGILSWVAPAVRDALVRCLEHAVAPGGLAMLSYNTPPAWGDAMFFQHLASARQHSGAGGGLAALNETVAAFKTLIAHQAPPVLMYPKTVSRIEGLAQRPAAYLVQEYMHHNWQPLWPSQVQGMLGAAKLQPAGNAELKDMWIPGLLAPVLQDLLKPHAGTPLAEDWVDYLSVKSFRRDVFQRGFTAALPLQQRQAILAQPLTCSLGALPENWVYTLSLGEISMAPERCRPIYEALIAGSKTVGELVQLPATQGWALADVLQVVTLALSKGDFMLSRTPTAVATKAVQRLNQAVARLACQGSKGLVLASARHASGVGVGGSDVFLYLLGALADGIPPQPLPLARALLQRLEQLGLPLASLHVATQAQEPQARAAELAEVFLRQVLPQWEALGAYSRVPAR